MSTREEQIAGLRELVDWLAAHPSVPLPWDGMTVFVENNRSIESKAEAVAALRAASAETGVALVGNRHLTLGRSFAGGISYSGIVCDYADAEDLTPGGGEVAGPVEGSGPATDTPWERPGRIEPQPVRDPALEG